MLNRREFSKYFLAGGTALLTPRSVWPSSSPAASPQQDANQTFDLLIEGGTVIDPGQNLHGPLDVAIKDGKILAVSKNIPKERALKVVSAKDRIVTPGFIDLHAHCYDGVGIGVNADRSCLSRGVTTVVDAGSAGSPMFPNFRKYIINTSATRIVALVHIGLGEPAVGRQDRAGEQARRCWNQSATQRRHHWREGHRVSQKGAGSGGNSSTPLDGSH